MPGARQLSRYAALVHAIDGSRPVPKLGQRTKRAQAQRTEESQTRSGERDFRERTRKPGPETKASSRISKPLRIPSGRGRGLQPRPASERGEGGEAGDPSGFKLLEVCVCFFGLGFGCLYVPLTFLFGAWGKLLMLRVLHLFPADPMSRSWH